MYNWLSSLFTGTFFSGPARNAPGEGKNIKQALEAIPLETRGGISSMMLREKIASLKKVEINKQPYVTPRPALYLEFCEKTAQGYQNYFASLKNRRKSRSEVPGLIQDANCEAIVV